MTPTNEQIFKIQRPIVSSEPESAMLLYNKDKSSVAEVPNNEHTQELFEMGEDEFKCFAVFDVDDELYEIKYLRRAEWQDW